MSTTIYERLSNAEQTWVDQTIEKIKAKLSKVRERSAEKLPMTAINGVHNNKLNDQGPAAMGKGFWTNGFWAGLMWQMYHLTGEERYAEVARFTQPILDSTLTEQYTHDLGFLWLPTATADYKLTGNQAALGSSVAAASWLAGRFNPVGNYIRAWGCFNESFPLGVPGEGEVHTLGAAIIDCMMNLPLLYWASEVTKDPRYAFIAKKHADKTMQHHIREDGSVIHIVEYNPETGEYVQDFGGQGYARGSAWTRGQAWGIYGFTASFKHTGDAKYLETAQKVASFFISQIPEDGLIPEDFRQPAEPWVQDDIAAGCAASGLLELAGLDAVSDEDKEKYLAAALKLLHAIDEKSADWSVETDGITLNGSSGYHMPGRNMNYTYADYFFVEAILKLNGSAVYIW